MPHNNRMQIVTKRLLAYFFATCCFAFAGFALYLTFHEPNLNEQSRARLDKIEHFRSQLAEHIGPLIAQNKWVSEIELPDDGDKKQVHLHYTIDPDLQVAAEKLLKSYKPDYGAVAMMDAETGKILALASFNRHDPNSPHLALRASFPAASVFKIVTATAAIDKYNMGPNSIVAFNGGNHTLYKKNVMSDKVTRWTREMSLREAFARSINTFFGRLTLEKLEPGDLEEYAFRFGFNKNIVTDFNFESGFTEIPKDRSFHLTELASGFNKVTRMSPIQGAMIAGSIADDGTMRVPYIVDKATDDQGNVLFQSEPVTLGMTMTPAGADKLRDLMEATITQGTSRKSFRSLVKDRKFRELIVGGKTGSLTGDNPKGKVDWFVGYAMNENQKIAIAALTVNVNYWTVKSAYLAQSLFRTHFKDQFSKENEKFFHASSATGANEREPASTR